MNKDIITNKITKILYKELNNYLNNKDIIPNIINISIGSEYSKEVFSNMKEKTLSKETIIKYKNIYFDKITYQELIKKIQELNNDKDITGITICLPLPDYLKEYERKILDTISPIKDIEGLTSTSLGLLLTNQDTFIPCTALAIETLLKIYNIPLEGKKVSIINRSNIIGKPLFNLMLRNNATPIMCHSKTNNLANITSQSDIVVAALNKPQYIKKEYLKDDSIVIDVGIHKNNLGQTVGDVNYKDVINKVSLITPPTNSIGPMTICMLAYNSAKALYKEEVTNNLEYAINKAKNDNVNKYDRKEV